LGPQVQVSPQQQRPALGVTFLHLQVAGEHCEHLQFGLVMGLFAFPSTARVLALAMIKSIEPSISYRFYRQLAARRQRMAPNSQSRSTPVRSGPSSARGLLLPLFGPAGAIAECRLNLSTRNPARSLCRLSGNRSSTTVATLLRTFQFIGSIHDVQAKAWNRLLASAYPFLRHEYLSALQDTGATTRASGWQPHHLVVYEQETDGSGKHLIAAVPLFLKMHSYGEYVFDFAWARAYHQAGLNYYPKLVSCAPFAPDPGPRFLMAQHTDAKAIFLQMQRAIEDEAAALDASGVHCLFPDEASANALHQGQWQRRLGCQFHWYNRDYGSFDDFVQTFASRKRKNVLRERRLVAESGLRLSVTQGADISPTAWQKMYAFYRSTYAKRSGQSGYLNAGFFATIGQSMPESLMMIAAHDGDEMIAAALYFHDTDTLYGRFWGCEREVECLHFELCYYQGIEYAITNRLARFEPGAQGEHKIARGFVPTLTYSNHFIRHEGGRQALERFMRVEEGEVLAYQRSAMELLPFRARDHEAR
jgi:predicted N-acyltransferase